MIAAFMMVSQLKRYDIWCVCLYIFIYVENYDQVTLICLFDILTYLLMFN
jgi:hypothetical protein